MIKTYILLAAIGFVLPAVHGQASLQKSSKQPNNQTDLPKDFPDANKLSADDYKKAVKQWAQQHPDEYKALTRLHPSVTPEKLEQMRNEKNAGNRSVKPN
jgi:hypothetical protein